MRLFTFRGGSLSKGIQLSRKHTGKRSGQFFLEMGNNAHIDGDTHRARHLMLDTVYTPEVVDGVVNRGWVRWVYPRGGGDAFPVLAKPNPTHEDDGSRAIILVDSVRSGLDPAGGLIFTSPPQSEILLSATHVSQRHGHVVKSEHALVFLAARSGGIVELIDDNGQGHRITLTSKSISVEEVDEFMLIENNESKKIVKIDFG